MVTSRNRTWTPGEVSPNAATRNAYWEASAASVASSRESTAPARSCAESCAVNRMREFLSSCAPALLRAARSARSADSYPAAPPGSVARTAIRAFPDPKIAITAGAYVLAS